jgi:hypothetical protein
MFTKSIFNPTHQKSALYLEKQKSWKNMHSAVDAVGSSQILKGKQNLGVTFNFDKKDAIDFTKFSKMTTCRASEANS